MNLRRSVGALVAVAASFLGAGVADALPAGEPPTEVDVLRGDHLGGRRSALESDDDRFYRVRSTEGATPSVRYVAEFSAPTESASEIFLKVTSTRTCDAVIERFNFDTRSWEPAATGTVTPQAESSFFISALPGTTVSPDGEILIRVTCTGSGDPFTLKTDVLVVRPDPG